MKKIIFRQTEYVVFGGNELSTSHFNRRNTNGFIIRLA